MAIPEAAPQTTVDPTNEVGAAVRGSDFDPLFDIPRWPRSRDVSTHTIETTVALDGGDGATRQSLGPVIEALKVRMAKEAKLVIDEGPNSPYRTDKEPYDLIESLFSRIQVEKKIQDNDSRFVAIRLPGYLTMLSDVARYAEASIKRDTVNTDLDDADYAKQLELDHSETDDDSNFLLILDTENLSENGLPSLAGMARIAGPHSPLLKTIIDLPDNWEQYKNGGINTRLEPTSDSNLSDSGLGNLVMTADHSSLLVAREYRDPSLALSGVIAYELHAWYREGEHIQKPTDKEIQPALGFMRINLSAHGLIYEEPQIIESASQEAAAEMYTNSGSITQEVSEKEPKFTIRAAKLEDIPAIVDVDMQSFESVYKGYEEDWETIRADLIKKFTGRFEMIGGEWITVLERGGVMVGHMMSCPTSKKPEAFASWEETTDNGTLKTTYDPNGTEIYIISLAWLAEGADGMDMLYAHQMAKGLRKGYKRGFFESRVPGFRQYARRAAKKEGLSLEDLTADQLDEYANTYFQTTINRGGKAMPLDPLLRKYAGIGCNLLKLVPDAYQDEPSMNYGVVCTYDFSNLFDGSVLQYKIPRNKVTKSMKLAGKVLPFKIPRNRMTEWMFGVALGAASHSQKAVNEIF